MNYDAKIKEIEAQTIATERGYILNPWRVHSNEISRLRSALIDALSWKQFHNWSGMDCNRSYREGFENALKVSRSREIQAIALDGLKLVLRCEQLQAAKEMENA